MPTFAGEIIYKAFAPTLKMLMCIAIGFVITKRGIFPPASAKGVSILSLNVGLPALIFSSMVSAFTPQNISAFGSLAVVAFMYEIIGAMLALVVREFCYVPPDFQWGILVMGWVSNWGNLPIAVVQVVGLDSPFNPSTDVELGIAYVSVFVLIMNTCFFPLGLSKLCALDFKESNLIRAPPAPLRRRWASRLVTFQAWARRRRSKLNDDEMQDSASTLAHHQLQSTDAEEQKLPDASKRNSMSTSFVGERGEEPSALKVRPGYTYGSRMSRKVSQTPSLSSMLESTRPIPSTAPLDAVDMNSNCDPSLSNTPAQIQSACANHGRAYSFHQPASPVPTPRDPKLSKRLSGLVSGVLTPVSMAIVIALPCSVISPLKALFIHVDGWSGLRIPNAPDGNPPLAFIFNTAVFVGGMSVPSGLILLGASFARLKMPKTWRDLPIAAIVSMTAVKMVIVPLFGYFFVQALEDRSSLYPSDDKMRTFVGILVSGTPAAVNQLVVTQLYNPEGSAHTLAMFLLLQYFVMPVLSTALAAVALYKVSS